MIPKFFIVAILNTMVLGWAGYQSFQNPLLLTLVVISFINILRELNIGSESLNKESSE